MIPVLAELSYSDYMLNILYYQILNASSTFLAIKSQRKVVSCVTTHHNNALMESNHRLF